MDPKANLEEMRNLCMSVMSRIDAADPDTGEWLSDPDTEYRMAELFQALDNWLSKGGFSPF